MLAKESVKAFLEKPRDQFEWIKSASREELEAAILKICPSFSPKIKLYTHQLASIYLGLCHEGFLYFLDMGTGKEQPLTSKVLTPTGWKLMGDLQEGMTICHPFHGTSQITAVFPQGFKDVYKVTFTDGCSVECGYKHLWTVTIDSEEADYEITTVEHLFNSLKNKKGEYIRYIPMTDPVELTPLRTEPFVIHPYILGSLISELSLLEGYPEYRQTWIKELNRLKLYGISYNKYIPKEYLIASIEARISLLQGLMDIDGYIAHDGSCVRWTTSSESMIEGFEFLIHSLGGTTQTLLKTVKRAKYWIINITLPGEIPLFRTARKQSLWEKFCHLYQPSRAIQSIKFLNRQKSQCILIDRPDGLYITEHGVVTHNTGVALSVIQCRKELRKIKRILVLVPNLVNVESWLEEINKFTDLTAVGLVGTKAERMELIKQKSDVKILNYDGLPIFTTDFKEVSGKKAKRKRVINQKMLRAFATTFDMVIFDEIHHVKHTNTLTYQLCNVISQHAKYRLGLTGTPVGRDPQNFWAQFHIVDHGETLGTTKAVFLQALFVQQAGYWGGVKSVLPKKNEPILKQMLQHRSVRYADHECSDLPPVSMIEIPLTLPADTYKMYRNLVVESIEQARGTGKEAQEKRKNYYSKTRQVASGFMYEDMDETRVTLKFTNPKLDALEEILLDVPTTSKVVIFHVFNQSGLDIIDRLKQLKIKYAAMNVAAEKGNKVEQYKAFKTDAKTRVLVVNIASGGEGLNLQDANYCIFYEPVDRPDVHRQALKRCHRIGQTKHTYIYQFMVKGTVECKIFEFLKEGKSLFSALVEGKIDMETALL